MPEDVVATNWWGNAQPLHRHKKLAMLQVMKANEEVVCVDGNNTPKLVDKNGPLYWLLAFLAQMEQTAFSSQTDGIGHNFFPGVAAQLLLQYTTAAKGTPLQKSCAEFLETFQKNDGKQKLVECVTNRLKKDHELALKLDDIETIKCILADTQVMKTVLGKALEEIFEASVPSMQKSVPKTQAPKNTFKVLFQGRVHEIVTNILHEPIDENEAGANMEVDEKGVRRECLFDRINDVMQASQKPASAEFEEFQEKNDHLSEEDKERAYALFRKAVVPVSEEMAMQQRITTSHKDMTFMQVVCALKSGEMEMADPSSPLMQRLVCVAGLTDRVFNQCTMSNNHLTVIRFYCSEQQKWRQLVLDGYNTLNGAILSTSKETSFTAYLEEIPTTFTDSMLGKTLLQTKYHVTQKQGPFESIIQANNGMKLADKQPEHAPQDPSELLKLLHEFNFFGAEEDSSRYFGLFSNVTYNYCAELGFAHGLSAADLYTYTYECQRIVTTINEKGNVFANLSEEARAFLRITDKMLQWLKKQSKYNPNTLWHKLLSMAHAIFYQSLAGSGLNFDTYDGTKTDYLLSGEIEEIQDELDKEARMRKKPEDNFEKDARKAICGKMARYFSTYEKCLNKIFKEKNNFPVSLRMAAAFAEVLLYCKDKADANKVSFEITEDTVDMMWKFGVYYKSDMPEVPENMASIHKKLSFLQTLKSLCEKDFTPYSRDDRHKTAIKQTIRVLYELFTDPAKAKVFLPKPKPETPISDAKSAAGGKDEDTGHSDKKRKA